MNFSADSAPSPRQHQCASFFCLRMLRPWRPQLAWSVRPWPSGATKTAVSKLSTWSAEVDLWRALCISMLAAFISGAGAAFAHGGSAGALSAAETPAAAAIPSVLLMWLLVRRHGRSLVTSELAAVTFLMTATAACSPISESPGCRGWLLSWGFGGAAALYAHGIHAERAPCMTLTTTFCLAVLCGIAPATSLHGFLQRLGLVMSMVVTPLAMLGCLPFGGRGGVDPTLMVVPSMEQSAHPVVATDAQDALVSQDAGAAEPPPGVSTPVVSDVAVPASQCMTSAGQALVATHSAAWAYWSRWLSLGTGSINCFRADESSAVVDAGEIQICLHARTRDCPGFYRDICSPVNPSGASSGTCEIISASPAPTFAKELVAPVQQPMVASNQAMGAGMSIIALPGGDDDDGTAPPAAESQSTSAALSPKRPCRAVRRCCREPASDSEG